MNSLTLKSPAKLNLFLEVLKRREDDFHQIETIFQIIGFYDFIHIKKSKKDGIFISTNSGNLPTDKRNLVYRAIEMLKQKYSFGGVEISIDKRIPLASGLGGGSSNAATALMGVNMLWDLGLEFEQLYEICAKIGSDVPLFVSKHTSVLGSGRGEILKPLNLPAYWFLLVLPDFGISSKEVYNRLQLNLTKKTKSVKMLIRALEKKDISQIAKKVYNRLEQNVLSEFPLVKKIKQSLKTAGCKAVLMSGSGPVVFALTLTRKEAIKVRERLKFLGWHVEVVRSI